MRPFLTPLFAFFPAMTHASTMWNSPSNNDWLSPELLEVQEGSNLIDNSLPGGGFCPLFYTLQVPEGLAVTALNVITYDDGGNTTNGGSLLALQIGSTLSDSPRVINDDFRIRINNVLFSEINIGQTDLLQILNVGEQLEGAPTLVARDYALFINETGPGIDRFVLDFVATPVPEPSTLSLLLALPLFFRRHRTS